MLCRRTWLATTTPSRRCRHRASHGPSPLQIKYVERLRDENAALKKEAVQLRAQVTERDTHVSIHDGAGAAAAEAVTFIPLLLCSMHAHHGY